MDTILPLPFLPFVDLNDLLNPTEARTGLTATQVSYLGCIAFAPTPDTLEILLHFLKTNLSVESYVDVSAIESTDDILTILNGGARKVFVTYAQWHSKELKSYLDRVIPRAGMPIHSELSFPNGVCIVTDSAVVSVQLLQQQAKKTSPIFMTTPPGSGVTSYVNLVTTEASAIPLIPVSELTFGEGSADMVSVPELIGKLWNSDRPDKLLPTVVTDESGVALGLVYSSQESLAETLKTGTGVYQSRKRGLWYKGATSGDTQELVRIALDCDQDCLKFVVRQKGNGFCHLPQGTCFGQLRGLAKLEKTLFSRMESSPEGSYTARLFSDEKLLRAKIMEEAEELCDANTKSDVAFEAADLIYFALTKAVSAGVSLADIEQSLDAKSVKVKRRTGDAKGKWAEKEGISTGAKRKLTAEADASKVGLEREPEESDALLKKRRKLKANELKHSPAEQLRKKQAKSIALSAQLRTRWENGHLPGAMEPRKAANAAKAAPAGTGAGTGKPILVTLLEGRPAARITMKRYDAKTSTPEELQAVLKRPSQKSTEMIMGIVNPIITSVREGGDKALLGFTHKFEKATSLTSPVLKAPFPQHLMNISPDTIAAIDISFENIRAFHAAQKEDPLQVETMPGVMCSRFSRPIERVGLYVPGGTAVLPSTALMLGVPAMVAGCKKIVLASPPRADGSITPEIVYVAHKVGAESIVLAGGAQAVAAMAYGTESVTKVDKILGPGNQFVTAAKMYVSNDTNAGVSIDMPAGPSEVLVIADKESNPAFVASDLLSQAEHGVDSQVILIAIDLSEKELTAIEDELHKQAMALPRVDIVRGAIEHSVTLVVKDIEEAMKLSNDYAPEHLILQLKDAAKVVDLVENAGSVFIGEWTPESVGDYSAGVNHSLPTYGFAKQYSGVNLGSYLKHITSSQLTAEGLRNVGGAVMQLAKVEELEAHRRAVEIRWKYMDENKL